MYVIWVKLDQTLPWIELEGAHKTRREARRAGGEVLNHAMVRIVAIPKKKPKP